MENQGTDTKVEGAGQAGKQAESTQSEEQPTGYKTEEDFQRAVSKGLENIQRQLDLRKTEADKYKSEADQHKFKSEGMDRMVKSLERQIETITQAIDDPDVKSGILSKVQQDRREQQLLDLKAEAENKLYEAEKLAWSARMAQKADAIHRETDIPISELEDCQTEEEMEVKGLRYKLAKAEEPKEPKEKTPKFAGGSGGGGGDSWKKLSPEGKIAFGLKNKK